jgi:hypothetical protein
MADSKTVRANLPSLLRRTPEPETPEPAPKPAKSKRIARTFYLDQDVVAALDAWVMQNWTAGAKKPEMSTFVSQAIREALKSNTSS